MLISQKKKARGQTKVVVRAAMAASSTPTIRLSPAKHKKKARNGARTGMSGIAGEYVRTLEDPFEYGPVKLGYNCFVPTVLASGFNRSSLTVNATDGSFALAMFPSVSNQVLIQNAGRTSATWTTSPSFNATAITNNGVEGRIVSGGIRCFALFPQTSQPGVLFAGTLNGQTPASFVSLSPNNLITQADAEIGHGANGARVVLRPQDNDAYVFSLNAIAGPTNVLSSTTSGYIVGIGFPIGTVVYFESILNLEMLPNEGLNSVGINSNEVPSLADVFPTPERAFRAISGMLGNAAIMDGVEGLASNFSPTLGKAVRVVRSAYGQGRHFRESVAGASQSRIARQSSVVIEEMKEGGWQRVR